MILFTVSMETMMNTAIGTVSLHKLLFWWLHNSQVQTSLICGYIHAVQRQLCAEVSSGNNGTRSGGLTRVVLRKVGAMRSSSLCRTTSGNWFNKVYSDLGLGDKMILIRGRNKSTSAAMISFGRFSSIWIDQTVYGLHVKVHAHFLPRCLSYWWRKWMSSGKEEKYWMGPRGTKATCASLLMVEFLTLIQHLEKFTQHWWHRMCDFN